MLDTTKLSQDVKEDLQELRELFSRLSGWTLRKLAYDAKQAPDFGRKIASMIVTLSIYNHILLRRLFSSDVALRGAEPPLLAEVRHWVKQVKRQPERRTAKRRLRELLDSLDQHIGCLDQATLMLLPSRADDIPELLTLLVIVQTHLAWYLDVEWLPRMFEFEPLPGNEATE